MDAINEYWQIIVGVITLIVILSKLHLDVEILKQKVKSLFELFNRKEKQMLEWIISNWEWCLIAFMIAEKCVKASKTQADDILLDIVWKNIKKLAKK